MKATALALLFLSASTTLAAQQPTAADQWDARFSRGMYLYGKEPVVFLTEQIGRLPRGRALVLAAGEGRNAVYLAGQGFEVTAVDVSSKGLEKCKALADERGVKVSTVVADLNDYDLGTEQYDVITMFYYHQPDLFPKIVEALAPGGMFVLQHFSVDQPKTNRFGPREPEFLVAPNELVKRFEQIPGVRIRFYEDTLVELDEGMHQGTAAVVRLLVEKER